MGHIMHVELTSAAPQATADFYSRAFGWRTEASPFLPDYLLAQTGDGPGIDAAIMSREHQEQAAIIWIQVEDIDAARAAVTEAGGDASGEVHDLPGEGRVGYVTDPDGVVLGLKQPA
ncbi:VOC family protein [Nesterenkonia sp. PF2B19]|uniref:VOC family protein n=1 Tax=unclassified Nesterenkonia TaxID=2629769 RepID=UPI0008721E4B|nr:VOC family protein [Nesterenkonia sp. PF2B19]OSM42653.1 hypothetical protein BCY76_013110 [Nesterenkonia sp. PF2B19]